MHYYLFVTANFCGPVGEKNAFVNVKERYSMSNSVSVALELAKGDTPSLLHFSLFLTLSEQKNTS